MKILLLFVWCVFVITYCASADSFGLSQVKGYELNKRASFGGTCGNISWVFNNDTKQLTMKGVGTMPTLCFDKMKNVSEEAKSVIVEHGITNVAQSTFKTWLKLESVSLPDTVTELGISAFEGCTNLTSINIPKNLVRFGSSCFKESSIRSIVIPEGTTKIFSYAFRDCKNLAVVVLPLSLESIYSGAFYGCTSLSEINIPDNVTSIGSEAFNRCSSLPSVVIPDGVTKILDATFFGCTSMKSLKLSNNLVSIGPNAFNGCNLTSLTIPASTTSIGSFAFSKCSSLKTLTYLGSSDPWTGALEPFSECPQLSTINIPYGFQNTSFCNISQNEFSYGYIVTCKGVVSDSWVLANGTSLFGKGGITELNRYFESDEYVVGDTDNNVLVEPGFIITRNTNLIVMKNNSLVIVFDGEISDIDITELISEISNRTGIPVDSIIADAKTNDGVLSVTVYVATPETAEFIVDMITDLSEDTNCHAKFLCRTKSVYIVIDNGSFEIELCSRITITSSVLFIAHLLLACFMQ